MSALERLHPGIGIAVVRITAGIILVVAGVQKWIGPGIAGIAGFFGSVGIPLPSVMAPALMTFEVVGGLLLIVGAFSRYLGALMIVQFLVAGFLVSWPSQGGWMMARMDFIMAATGALFLLSGGGLYSVDAWLAERRSTPVPTRSASY